MASNWQDIPFAPKRWPFFYGWVIVFATTVGILSSMPGQTIGVGVFTDDLIAALELDRLQLSTAYMVATLTSAMMLPLAGTLIDRIGARAMIVIAAIGLGLSMLFLSQTERLCRIGDTHSLWLSMSVASFSFLAIRFFGQGCLTMTSRVALSKWFNHRRGVAVAISGVFVTFGFNASPQILNELVMGYGWKGACWILAGVVGVGMSVFGWIFYRDNPEECGLQMDGDVSEEWRKKMEARVPDIVKEFTRGEALLTLSFWVFSIGVATHSLLITAITFHIASMGEEMLMNRDESFAVFMPMSYFAVVSNLGSGWLSDRIHLKWLLLAFFATQAASIAGLLHLGEPSGKWLFIVAGGFSGGFFGTLVTVTWPRYFGRKHLGAITGANMSIMVAASALGPVLFAWMREWTGSFKTVVHLSWFMPITLMALGMWVENPQDKIRREADAS